MNNICRLAAGLTGGTALIALLAAAASPSAISRAEGGLWEISRTGAEPTRLCVSDPSSLAQFQHRNARCTSRVIRDSGSSATIHYTCTGGGFGHSDVTLVTPRSLRIETQGIADSAPFKYVLQARRVGNCPGH